MDLVSIITVVIGIFVILCALVLGVFLWVKKKKSGKKSSKTLSIFIYFLLVLILVTSLGLVIGIHLINTDVVEEKMDRIVNETNTILVNAKQRLEGVALAKLDLSDLEKSKKVIKEDVQYVMPKFSEKIGLEELSKKKDEYSVTETDTKNGLGAFQPWIEALYKAYPTSCGSKGDIDKKNIYDQLVQLSMDRKPLSSAIGTAKIKLDEMVAGLYGHATAQQALIVGNTEIEKRLEEMSDMIVHFQDDVNKFETTRLQWQKKMTDESPTLSPLTHMKIVVTGACVILSLLSIFVTVFVIILKKFGAGTVKALFYFTVILTVVAAVWAILISSGLLGVFDCPLKKSSFGLSNFTTKFQKNESFSICANNSTFFEHLMKKQLITSDGIAHSFEIKNYEKKMLGIVIESKNLTVTIPPKFTEELSVIEKATESLNTLFGANCLDTNKQNELSGYRDLLGKFVNESNIYKGLLENFNNQVEKTESIFGSIIEESYAKVVTSFEKSISGISNKIATVDFSCSPIIASFSSCGKSICRQFEPPASIFWVILSMTMVLLLIVLLFLALVYYSLVTPGETKKILEKPVTPTKPPSPPPTTTPPPPPPQPRSSNRPAPPSRVLSPSQSAAPTRNPNGSTMTLPTIRPRPPTSN